MMKGKILAVLLAVTLVSCKTNPNAHNDLNYMQNIENVAIEASAKNSQNTIQPGDQLVILITAKDLDVVKPFNQNFSSSEFVQNNTFAGGNTPGSRISKCFRTHLYCRFKWRYRFSNFRKAQYNE
jgi:polysaccharide export outer membrane protein